MMTFQIPRYIKFAIILFIVTVLFVILESARDIIIPIAVALFLTFLLFPISDWLQRYHWPRWLSILISILIAVILVGGLLYFFIYQIVSFQEDLPQLQESLKVKMDAGQHYIEQQLDISRRDQTKWMDKKIAQLGEDASSYLMSIFSATGNVLANLALIPIYIFFMTFYKDKFKRFVSLVTENGSQTKIFMIMEKVSRVSQQYIKGILIDILILSILNSTGFLILGIKHAILFGTLAAFLNIVPYVGVLVGSIFPIIIALLTKDTVWYAVGAAGVCVFVQFLDNNFITPKVVGSSVSINPLVATLALILGAKVWGVMGMILFIPMTGMVKVLCDNISFMKPYGFLLGEEADMKSPAHTDGDGPDKDTTVIQPSMP